MEVIVQAWLESEQGWGSRPDGVSIHFTEEQHKTYIDKYWDKLQEVHGNSTPHEYSRPEGEPVKMIIVREDADESVLALALAGKSIRRWENNPKWLKKAY